jgi:hypothetical protein
MSDLLKPADFRDLPGPLALDLALANSVRCLELAVQSIVPLPPHRLRAEPFSLVLSGPPTPALPQASYRVRHPRLGPIDLFLVPIARDAASAQYEATFN